jgi:hypothetical protein
MQMSNVKIKPITGLYGDWGLLAVDPGVSIGTAFFYLGAQSQMLVRTETLLWPEQIEELASLISRANFGAVEIYHIFPHKAKAQFWVQPPAALVQGYMMGKFGEEDALHELALYQPSQTKSITDDFIRKHVPNLKLTHNNRHETDAVRVGLHWIIDNWQDVK